jgi:hypothetical protein
MPQKSLRIRYRESATRSPKYKANTPMRNFINVINLLEIGTHAYTILVGKSEGRRLCASRLERNGTTTVKGISRKHGVRGVDYTRKAQDRDHAEEISGPIAE